MIFPDIHEPKVGVWMLLRLPKNFKKRAQRRQCKNQVAGAATIAAIVAADATDTADSTFSINAYAVAKAFDVAAIAADIITADNTSSINEYIMHMRTFVESNEFPETCLCRIEKVYPDWKILTVKPLFEKPFSVFAEFPMSLSTDGLTNLTESEE